MKNISNLILIILTAAFFGSVSGLSLLGFSRDYFNYDNLYQEIAIDQDGETKKLNDLLFYYSIKLFSSFFVEFEYFYLFFCLITIGVLFFGIGLTKTRLFIFLVIWMSLSFGLHYYTQVRAGLAIAILICAFYAQKRLITCLLSILAITAHISALIPVVIYYFALTPRKLKTLILVGFFLSWAFFLLNRDNLVLSIIINYLPDERLLKYIELLGKGEFTEQNMLAAMPILQLLATIHILARRCILPNYKFEVYLSFAGPVLFYMLSSIPVFAIRGYELFIPFFIIMISRKEYGSIFLYFILFAYLIFGLKSSFFGSLPIIQI